MSVSSQSTLKKNYSPFETIESRLVQVLKKTYLQGHQVLTKGVETLLGAHGGTTQH